MRPALLTVALLAMTTGAAWARIGETEEEITARYGKRIADVTQETSILFHDAKPILRFQKDGINVQVAFRNGQSVAETFTKASGADFSDAEVMGLLAANQGPSKWVLVFHDTNPIAYVREDRLLSADHDLNKHTLQIQWHDLWSDHPTQPDRVMSGF